ncbi:type III secretion system inner membrane ring lipoprotein SctJ [Spartinivicinus poritis]|uniref:Lipoprotein n=1 Tax=Spartinivicinus poritis TaxID=2994640 RepID=A0ABT5U657_9GAMM|nr:type III secretion inner membrane ring lipoprotein SctJ [Spartinivicinus sp. A2-2]MDE1460948.1 type III secretion inner membrane ring lipoprotein SctJ [Spartinivicinus sp. A2-2]
MKRLIMLLIVIVLSGCDKELVTGLTEREANEVSVTLFRNNIKSEVVTTKKLGVKVIVAKDDFIKASMVLKRHGLPKKKYASIGDVFKKDGLISSQTEEKNRTVYALSEELSHTISMIDGVVEARVHIVINDKKKRYSKEPKVPNTASVMIKALPNYNVNHYVPQIKKMVAKSITGVTYKNVAVTVFPYLAETNTSGIGVVASDKNNGTNTGINLLITLLVMCSIVGVSLLGFRLYENHFAHGK